MTFKTFCVLAGVVSVILIAEIIFSCVLCSKLMKHRKETKEKDAEKNTTKFHSFLGLSAILAYQISAVACLIILVAEIVFFAWTIVSIKKLLKAKDAEEKEEDIALAANMVRHSITLEEAHNALSDEAAYHLIEEEEEPEEILAAETPAGAPKHLWLHRRYKNKAIINVDTISQKFKDRDHVNLKTLKEKKLIHPNVDHIKVLGRGTLDKCLFVEANAFSADAVKMIVLTGGHAIKFVHEKHPSIHLLPHHK
jgi:ribosomal protein L18E